MTTQLGYSPYIPLQRNFPVDNVQALGVELDKTYVEVAYRLNQKTIGLFALNAPQITGETWYIKGQKRQQTLRQLYLITGTGNIPHGIKVNQIAGFTRIYGTFVDSPAGIWYPLPYVDTVAANNQVSVWVTDTNIVITGGGGAGQPVVSSGFCVLEWLTTTSTNS